MQLTKTQAGALIVVLGLLFYMAGRFWVFREPFSTIAPIRFGAALLIAATFFCQWQGTRLLSSVGRTSEFDARTRLRYTLQSLGTVLALACGALLLAWIPFALVSLEKTLLSLQLGIVFCGLALGLYLVVLRLSLDLIRRMTEDEEEPDREVPFRAWLKHLPVLFALGYGVAWYFQGPRNLVEIAATSLILAVAMIALGVNRLGQVANKTLDAYLH